MQRFCNAIPLYAHTILCISDNVNSIFRFFIVSPAVCERWTIMYEIFEQLLQKNGVTAYKVSKETGVTQSTLSDWKRGRSTPKSDNMKKIADYFGVSVDYLMTGKDEPKQKAPELTARDERDIAKDLNNIMQKLTSGEAGPASYDGEELDPEAAELFRDELEIALRRLKIINKEKYTPKKYKK